MFHSKDLSQAHVTRSWVPEAMTSCSFSSLEQLGLKRGLIDNIIWTQAGLELNAGSIK